MMGLFRRVAKRLPKQFSIFQLMALLAMDQSDHREARNLLTQWTQWDLITRISQNMYEQVNYEREPAPDEE